MISTPSKPLVTKIITAAMAVIFVLPTFPAPVQAAAENSYAIKLQSGVPQTILSRYGTHVLHRFLFSSQSQFQNIYTFDSFVPLTTLQTDLAGSYSYLEVNQNLQSKSVFINDPGFTTDYQNIDKEWGLVKAGFIGAWTETIGSQQNIVAVIDTGIDFTHQDLQSISVVNGYDFVNSAPLSGMVDSDDNGHGTLVAGILGATANNGIGIAGTNWQISLMPIKALDSEGKGDAATIAESITWAADHGANIINLSLGGIGFNHDTTMANAISYAFNKNIVIVAAAGNDVAKTGGNLDVNPVFPVCDDNNANMVIGVAASDQNDVKADFSNYGKGCVDVTAPGKRILSTINFDPVTKLAAPNSYAYASGTSLAAPFVSGEAALIHALHPGLTNIQIRDRIIRGADPIDALNPLECSGTSCAGLLGSGRINAQKSLDLQTDTPIAQEGDLVEQEGDTVVYYISGGQKRPVSTFVQNQRFSGVAIRSIPAAALDTFPLGPYATPNDGTLVKTDSDNTVYFMQQGLKLPVTFAVFSQRKFNFSDVNTVSFSELNSWVSGNFLPPAEGSLVKTQNNKTVYWVVDQVLHPVNYAFYVDQGLKIFPIFVVQDKDLENFPKGDAYIR